MGCIPSGVGCGWRVVGCGWHACLDLRWRESVPPTAAQSDTGSGWHQHAAVFRKRSPAAVVAASEVGRNRRRMAPQAPFARESLLTDQRRGKQRHQAGTSRVTFMNRFLSPPAPPRQCSSSQYSTTRRRARGRLVGRLGASSRACLASTVPPPSLPCSMRGV